MTQHQIKAGDLQPGDVMLNTTEYLTVVCVQSAPRDSKRVQVTLHDRRGKAMVLFLDRTRVLDVRRS